MSYLAMRKKRPKTIWSDGGRVERVACAMWAHATALSLSLCLCRWQIEISSVRSNHDLPGSKASAQATVGGFHKKAHHPKTEATGSKWPNRRRIRSLKGFQIGQR